MENRILLWRFEREERRELTDKVKKVAENKNVVKADEGRFRQWLYANMPYATNTGSADRFFTPARGVRRVARGKEEYWPLHSAKQHRFIKSADQGHVGDVLNIRCSGKMADPHDDCFNSDIEPQHLTEATASLELLWGLDPSWLSVRLEGVGNLNLEELRLSAKTWVLEFCMYIQKKKSDEDFQIPAAVDVYLDSLDQLLSSPSLHAQDPNLFMVAVYLAQKLNRLGDCDKPWEPFESSCKFKLELTPDFLGTFNAARTVTNSNCSRLLQMKAKPKADELNFYLDHRETYAFLKTYAVEKNPTLEDELQNALPQELVGIKFVTDVRGGINEVETKSFYQIVREYQVKFQLEVANGRVVSWV
ncbi:hypothetical protein BJ508DRAFT_333250 [Ascobolus immersus RN42]|uniref:Uncharacterized protein n=1 Tax=Ascobolus immersus RN42 TaxID=1160509 RepID=A0A3N4HK21_ASCIM|nr:hypothetical protein BJ508DRAFT_333250 [Ascobolus immersus RN42]